MATSGGQKTQCMYSLILGALTGLTMHCNVSKESESDAFKNNGNENKPHYMAMRGRAVKSIFIKSSFSLLKDGIKNNVLQFFLDAIAITKQSNPPLPPSFQCCRSLPASFQPLPFNMHPHHHGLHINALD
ncbi:hypothetical protein AB205_0112790 [Aquarana catesbeiana]|uniref:Uncharacterized protein n=1 Tax=Aquarana catesbeiana TaxID=8400 RepID=A0A2G9RE10_AQUCT|nr:hypothetical protein AB205_0112790 [Aquarana catesbeiana]